MEGPVVPLERNLYRHPLAGLLWERQFENAYLHNDKEGLFLSVYVYDIKQAGKKQNIDPMWKVLVKEVGLGEPTSLLDHVYLGCTQRQCEISKDTVDNYRNTLPPETYAVSFLFWQEISVCSFSFGAGRIFFLRLQFLTCMELFLHDLQFSRCVRSVQRQ